MFNKKRFNDSGKDKDVGRDGQRERSFDHLFDTDWEVFVIKRDKTTGKLIGRTACCALAKVD